MSLIVVGLNHKTASINIREKMSIAESDIPKAVKEFCTVENITSCVVISTCNRTEFYISCDQEQTAINRFCFWFDITFKNINQHLYIKSDQQCVEHLFSVASGLDSMVLGEAQILGQVKTSYTLSKQGVKLDIILERLFQSTFKVAKLVRSETDIGKNPVSVANSAVQLSKQIFGDLSQQNILMISAGATADLLLRYLNKHTYQNLSICNRSIENAKKLAQQFNCNSFALEKLTGNIAEYDLIFTATSSKLPIISNAMVKNALKQRKHKPMVIIDLAIPRDTEIGISKFNDIFYYTVDDLQKVIQQNRKNREFSALQAQQIISVEAESFLDWLKGQQHTNLIHRFQKETAKIRKKSLDIALKKLKNGVDAEEVLYFLANNLTNKLNHAPVKALRAAIQSGDLNNINRIKILLSPDGNNDT